MEIMADEPVVDTPPQEPEPVQTTLPDLVTRVSDVKKPEPTDN